MPVVVRHDRRVALGGADDGAAGDRRIGDPHRVTMRVRMHMRLGDEQSSLHRHREQGYQSRCRSPPKEAHCVSRGSGTIRSKLGRAKDTPAGRDAAPLPKGQLWAPAVKQPGVWGAPQRTRAC